MNREDIIRMAREAGAIHIHGNPKEFALAGNKEIERFAALVASSEREACAKIADQYVGQDLEHNFSALVAHNIRARGQA